MSHAPRRPEIPVWFAGVVAILFVASFGYGIVVMQSLTALAILWLGILVVGLVLFTVYLLYRFVLAIEKIADKI